MFQCARVRPGTNSEFFKGNMDDGGLLNGLAHLDQALEVYFSTTQAPKW